MQERRKSRKSRRLDVVREFDIRRSRSRSPDLERNAQDIRAVTDLSNVIGLPRKLYYRHRVDLIYPMPITRDRHAYVVNLSELHRLNLQSLRRDLGAAAIKISRDKTLEDRKSDDLVRLMTSYCQALRDWDYICSKHDDSIKRDPFKLVSTQLCDAAIMEEFSIATAVPHRTNDKYNPDDRLMLPLDLDNLWLPGGSRSSAQSQIRSRNVWERFMWALLGGLALVGPMLLMVLRKDLATTLTVTSVATLAFALCAAALTDKTSLELTGATAGYAAVLVVFVGVSAG